mmetsp:Transcript_26043/g.77100  ORF Transcript_26043/g.77100 Transcript_26043/m.77100 type:complete len:112 (-) Transcript_26043:87-422(-)
MFPDAEGHVSSDRLFNRAKRDGFRSPRSGETKVRGGQKGAAAAGAGAGAAAAPTTDDDDDDEEQVSWNLPDGGDRADDSDSDSDATRTSKGISASRRKSSKEYEACTCADT